jgi:predicted ATPase/class 3 adenylate cyclase
MAEKSYKCSLCGFENPPQMRFCGGCGTPIADVAVEEERKNVAVLFADICDFTALVASRDPEETKDKIEGCLRAMADQVAAMDGVVEKFIGDAIMAVFGVPAAHDNDAELAVRAGLQILEHARWFGASAGLEIEFRIAVHFGEAIVSAHDRAPGREHHVFGEVVNVASRLEKTGEAGAVVVSEEVYKRTRGFFDFAALPPVKAKGVAEPLVRYRVLGERAERGKVRGIEGLSAPMIGRDDELRVLMDAYAAAARGEGARFAAVVGEAGIGKTRLTEELIRALRAAGQEPRVLHGRCLAYAGAPSYLPFVQIIKKAAGVKDDMTVAEIRERLGAAATGAFGDTRLGGIAVDEVLSELLAVGGDGHRARGHDTEQMRDQIFIVVEKYFAAVAAKSPTLVILEDVQWADGSSLALVEHLARTLNGARCLMILNSRPPEDYRSRTADLLGKLGADDLFVRVDLEDLSATESSELVAALLEVEKLPAKTRGFIVERAAGNPFFVEEIIKTLIEAGVLVQSGDSWAAARDVEELDIPDTIEGVLRSRIDNLPRQHKSLIQRAAVVGEVFWRKIVAELMERSVDDYLSDLERRDLVRQRLESIFDDDLEYIFKHAILHETVYNGILRRVRRDLHLKTALWIESNYGDRIDAYLSLVGHHFEMAGEKAKAADYYLRAAGRAASLYANDNAKEFYARAAASATAAPLLRQIYTGWGEVCARTGANDEALAHYETAFEYIDTIYQEAEILQRLGDVYERMSAYGKALDYYDRAEALLADQPAQLVHAEVFKGKAWVYYLKGEFDEAFESAQRAEAMVRTLGRDDAQTDNVRARVCSIMGAVSHERNSPKEARDFYDRTLALYEKHGNLYGVGTVLNNIGTTEITKGRLSAAVSFLERSFELGGQAGNRFSQAVNCCNLGEIYLCLGEYGEACKYFALYLGINRAIANRLGDGYAYSGLARSAAETGRDAEAENYFRRSVAVFEEVGAAGNARETRLAYADSLARAGRWGEACRIIDAESEVQEDPRLHFWVAVAAARRCAADKASLQRITTQASVALEHLTDEIERLELTAALARLFTAIGDEEESRKHRADAENIAARIEEHVDDERLRQSFRGRVNKELFAT